ncbi:MULTISPECIES: L,D-transpeptidase family protein [unclassified Pseudoalteromonas]|uniref:L,D-transpeptidase family protein n=1 Tax=unclassified Pseudoalteromonas TaxID=194690 RepID=UPI001F031263|nr:MULTISPECIES: L,D-transpeptidase family protein [unclassified Pseudoalteromonas]
MNNTLTSLIMLIASACSGPAWAKAEPEPIKDDNRQLAVVVTDSWTDIQGEMTLFERGDDNQWHAIGEPGAVVIGRTGLAWGIGLHELQQGQQKVEGDGKAPAGVFRLGNAFGYMDALTTGLDYHPMDAGDYCIDVNGSPYYNQLVNTKVVGEKAVEGSSEAMRRDIHSQDDLYKKGIIVAHNPENISGAGSCIFMHLWRAADKPTAGCTAMAEADMDALLRWLDKDKQPLMVILPRMEYALKQTLWRLPPLGPQK